MVIELHVAKECLVQIVGANQPVGLEHITDPAVEAFDQPVGFAASALGSVGAQAPGPGTTRQIHDFYWAYVQARQAIDR